MTATTCRKVQNMAAIGLLYELGTVEIADIA